MQAKQDAGGHANPPASSVKIDLKGITTLSSQSNKSNSAVQTKQNTGGHINQSMSGVIINIKSNTTQSNQNNKGIGDTQSKQITKATDKSNGTVNPVVNNVTKVNIGSQIQTSFKNVAEATKQIGNKYEKYMDSGKAGYMAKSVDQFVRGNYTENVTGLGTVGQVAAGIVGVDIPMDIRDITHDIKNWDGSKKHAAKTALDVASVLPVVGGITSAVKKGDNIIALAKSGEKILTSSTDVAKVADKAKTIDKVSDIAKNTTNPIKGGSAGNTRIDYKKVFFDQNPDLKGQVVVHHGVEQQVLTRPETKGLFTPEEIHAYDNLRGIPNQVNSDIHLSKIRKDWNKFYKENPNPTKDQLLEKRVEIDQKYGEQFNPPINK